MCTNLMWYPVAQYVWVWHAQGQYGQMGAKTSGMMQSNVMCCNTIGQVRMRDNGSANLPAEYLKKAFVFTTME